jgi:predicted component of type VI protein secretion system
VIRIKGLDAQAQKEKQYVFTTSPVRIGRSQLNDLSLPHAFVSLFHALVRFDAKGMYVLDLGSTNGVNVNGARIGKNLLVRVSEGTRVSIGEIEMHLARDASAVGDGQSRMTQFRAFATLMDPNEEPREEPASFRPTPVRGREPVVATALLPAFDAEAEQRARRELAEEPGVRTSLVPSLQLDHEVQEESARTIIAPIPTEDAEPKRPSPPRRHRTLTGGVRAMTPGVGGPQGAAMQLVPLYNAYRTAWQTLNAALVRNAAALEEADRGQFFSQLQHRMPELMHEPELEQFARVMGVVLPRAGGSSAGAAPAPAAGAPGRLDVMARQLLGQFVRSYLPGSRGLESGADIERFMDRLSEVLESIGRAFIELRQGHDQFGQEMSVSVGGDTTPLTRAKSTRDVLRYLLDFRAADGAGRVQELMGGFVDVMIHQIALINGMREGVRGMLQALGGDGDGEGGGLAKLWPFRASRRLREIQERVRTLAEEERELTAVLFGGEFAKAYLTIVDDAANNKGKPAEK